MARNDNLPDATWTGDPMAPWNREDEPEYEPASLDEWDEGSDGDFALSPMEKLAVAQAFYKAVSEVVSTKDPASLRSQVDGQMREQFERMRQAGTAPKSFDVELMGRKVGTYSITTTKATPQEERVEFVVEDQAAFDMWAMDNGFAKQAVVIDHAAVMAHFEQTGDVPDGCYPRNVVVPAVEGGYIKSTSLRVDKEKVVRALGTQLESATYQLLEEGGR